MWAIEKYINDRLAFWSPGARGRSGQNEWSERFDFAVKFFDRDSASMVLVHVLHGDGRAVEHSFMAAMQGVK